MKEYLTYIVAACALSCATTPPAKENSPVKPVENYQVQPVVIKISRDCNHLPPQELIDCLKEEGNNTTSYVPTPTAPPTTPSPYTVTPKVVETTCDPNLLPQELLKCIMKKGDEDSF